MNLKRFAPPLLLGVATVLFAGCQSTRVPASDATALHPAHTEAVQSPVLVASDIYTKDLSAFAVSDFSAAVLPASGMNDTAPADEHAHHMPKNKPVEDRADEEHKSVDHAAHGHAAHGHAETGHTATAHTTTVHTTAATDQPETEGFPDRAVELFNDFDRALNNINLQLKEEMHARISVNARVIIDVLDTLMQIPVPADPHVWHKTMEEMKTVRNLALKLESSESHAEGTMLHEVLEGEINAFLKAIGFSKPAEEKPAHNHGGGH
ncbi:MAG: hypothetical protein AB8G77_22040 [Rhodothermales bacterium]